MSLSVDQGSRTQAIKHYHDLLPGDRHDQAYADSFEAILGEYKESGQDAKTFLEAMDPQKREAVQKYQRVTDNIDTATMSAESAENMFRHVWEKVDMDGDGYYSTGGQGKILPDFPKDAPVEYIETMTAAMEAAKAGGMSEQDIFISTRVFELRFLTINIETGEMSLKSAPSDYTKEAFQSFLDMANENHELYGSGPESEAANKAFNLFFEYFDAAAEKMYELADARSQESNKDSSLRSEVERHTFLSRGNEVRNQTADHRDEGVLENALASV